MAWIGLKKVARFVRVEGARVPNPAWRPFVATVAKSAFRDGATASIKDYAPSQASLKALFSALSSFYDFLTQESTIPINPVSLIRQKSKFVRKDQNHSVVRRLSTLQWDYVFGDG